MDIFSYDFMIRAILVGFMLGIIIPLIGVNVVVKRLSMIGDALSHSSLAGVTIGLFFGFNPLLGAFIACLVASFLIEFIRKKSKFFEEMSISIVLSFSLAIAGIMSGLTKNSSNLSSFLFGSIVMISDMEFYFTIAIFLLVLIFMLIFYKDLLYLSVDQTSAELSGINTKLINSLFTFLTALTVSMASRSVGTLMVSSLIVLPVASSIKLTKSYKGLNLLSVLIGLITIELGLFMSFYLDLKPGSTIVLLNCILYIILTIFRRGK